VLSHREISAVRDCGWSHRSRLRQLDIDGGNRQNQRHLSGYDRLPPDPRRSHGGLARATDPSLIPLLWHAGCCRSRPAAIGMNMTCSDSTPGCYEARCHSDAVLVLHRRASGSGPVLKRLGHPTPLRTERTDRTSRSGRALSHWQRDRGSPLTADREPGAARSAGWLVRRGLAAAGVALEPDREGSVRVDGGVRDERHATDGTS
jgi:hypothetical protein